MNIVVIDGQGGGMGKMLVAAILEKYPAAAPTAVGTNSAATLAMRKAGATRAATGENAVVVACRTADVIVGPVGIAVADALMGEVTPRMAEAVGSSRARRVLIPVNACETIIVGVEEVGIATLVRKAVELL